MEKEMIRYAKFTKIDVDDFMNNFTQEEYNKLVKMTFDKQLKLLVKKGIKVNWVLVGSTRMR
jgi:hypothetical protein